MAMTADALRLGPLVFSWTVLLALATTWAGVAVAARRARRAGVDLGRTPETAALLGFVAARIGFVWSFAGAYLSRPWTLLDLRDGGWAPLVGLAAAWLYGLSRITRRPEAKPALRAGLLAATAIWATGTLALTVASHGGSGQRLPALTLERLEDGSAVSLDTFAGRPVVVNLWATWCPPCVREMPVLVQAQREHPGLHVVFVNQGESPERIRAWLAARGMAPQHMLLDRRGSATAAFDAAGLPTTLFFDARGRLVARRIGELSEATLAQQLERLRR